MARGQTLLAAERYPDACTELLECCRITEERGERPKLGFASLYLAQAYANMGSDTADKAAEQFAIAEQIARDCNMEPLLVQVQAALRPHPGGGT